MLPDQPAPEAPPARPVATRQRSLPAARAGRPPAPPVDAEVEGELTDEDPLDPGPAWPVYFAAAVVSVLWVAAPLAFAVGYRGDVVPFNNDTFALAVFAMLAIGPAAFVWIAAYMFRQGQVLAAEARRAHALADQMLLPAVSAGLRAGDLVEAISEEIVRAGEAADQARDTLLALREAMAQETLKLTDAAASSARSAHSLAETLGRERGEMSVLSQTLDAQAAKVADVIVQQARMVAEASDLAETQLREAEASLAARAADLAAAAGEASDAARTAGEDLNRHVARLETAGVGVAEQIRAVEGGLSEQRAALVSLAHALRADHEVFAAETETHAAQLSEFITQARLSAAEMGDRAVRSGESLRQLITDATQQFRALTDAVRAERTAFSEAGVHSLEDLSDAAAQERTRLEAQTQAAIQALARAAEETRDAAARNAAAAREQVDQLSEAAFAAGQQANKAFEQRLEEARALIERSAGMVEQAGMATARKLDEGAAAARATLEELQAMLAALEERAAVLPERVRGQAEEVRSAVTESMDELMGQARRAAEETQAIDAAFQDRVRRNYEMLSEAVRLMGTVATTGAAPLPVREAAPPAAARTPAPPPAESVAVEPPPQREPEEAQPQEPPVRPVVQVEEPAAPVQESAPEPGEADRLGLRPRLKLTPTATDEEFSSIFEAAAGRAPEEPTGEGEGWTWKELLSSIGERPAARAAAAEIEQEPLDEVLGREVASMGIDPAALLPQSRVEEVAATVQTGDLDGAREVVRRLAPAASRRIARRLLTDERLMAQVTEYLERYKALLGDAAKRDPEGFLVSTLLGSDAGRTYLVLEAAAGDLI